MGMHFSSHSSLRQRIVSAVSLALSSISFDLLGSGATRTTQSPGLGGVFGAHHNREKALGFAAAAVSLILVSGPFLLNVDSDVVAKAQTVAEVEAVTKPAEIFPEMATVDDVISALNVARESASLGSVVRDPQLHDGAQLWASMMAGSGNVRNDRSLRAMLQQRPEVGEFVIAARSLPLAYQRLMANPGQKAQLFDGTNIGVGVSVTENKTYLVVRFSR